MAQEFQHEAVTYILALGATRLTKIEIIVLKALQAAALSEIYWDTTGRLAAVITDLPIILRNITFKAKQAGLESVLIALKEKHANVQSTAVESCSRDPDVSLRAAPPVPAHATGGP